MTTPSFIRPDGVRLAYRDVGSGPAVLFQHGLGGDDAQVGDVFPHAAQVRRITLECRGQGRSAYGPQSALSIATFADDAIALLDHLRVPMPLVGGISMGAAIALRAAVLWPERFRGLVLARPAWVAETAPSNMAPYALVGELMVCHEPNKARRIFRESPIASLLAAQAPDNLASLLGFFARPRPKAFGALLKAIAADGPGVSEDAIAQIALPTLVIGHGRDFAHPLDYAERLAGLIPHAQLSVIVPKADDPAVYRREFRASLATFLGRWT